MVNFYRIYFPRVFSFGLVIVGPDHVEREFVSNLDWKSKRLIKKFKNLPRDKLR